MVVLKKNEEYLVFYKDDKRTRKKTFLFLGREGNQFVFLNVRTKKKEVIPSSKLVRWVSTKEVME